VGSHVSSVGGSMAGRQHDGIMLRFPSHVPLPPPLLPPLPACPPTCLPARPPACLPACSPALCLWVRPLRSTPPCGR
jgi:hypothetical protein